MSDRNTYYSGSLKIELEQTGISKDGRDVFKGTIILTDGRRHDFEDLGSGCGGGAPPGDLASASGDAADYTPEEIPDGMRTGETDEDESVYWGDLYTIFDSLESQTKWYARMDEKASK